jgi:hypothetical protein
LLVPRLRRFVEALARARSGSKGAVLALLVLVVALAGCGGGDEKKAPERPVGITFAQGNKVKVGVAKSELLRRFGRPVLTGSPTPVFPRGCLYFAMKGKPLADVWQFCFDARGRVSEGATLYSPQQPRPPADASPARAVLIARGDSICQTESAELVKPSKRIAKGLKRLGQAKTKATRDELATAIGDFNDALKKAVSQLREFDAPSDKRSQLNGYLGELSQQARVLDQARSAQLAGDDARYSQLGDQFNKLAAKATPLAKQYGFQICTATKFK